MQSTWQNWIVQFPELLYILLDDGELAWVMRVHYKGNQMNSNSWNYSFTLWKLYTQKRFHSTLYNWPADPTNLPSNTSCSSVASSANSAASIVLNVTNAILAAFDQSIPNQHELLSRGTYMDAAWGISQILLLSDIACHLCMGTATHNLSCIPL